MAPMSGKGSYKLLLWRSVALLGPDGAEIVLPTRSLYLLLAVLALSERNDWPRGEIAALVWPESKPEKARGSLRTALTRLRQAVAAPLITTEGDTLCLNRALLKTDADEYCGEGDFFPGATNPWILTRKKFYIASKVESLLNKANELASKNRDDEALTAVEGAIRLDPLDRRAAALKIKLLKRLDRSQEAVVVSRSLERVQKISANERAAGALIHPLIPAAEFLLNSSPSQALSFLAATREHWKLVPASIAADLFKRVLSLTPDESQERKSVEALAIWLDVIRRNDVLPLKALLAKLRAAEEEQDFANASLIAAAISLAAQQKGSLALSYKYAKVRAQMLGKTHAPDAKALAHYQLANVERHCGLYDRARTRNETAIRLYEELGTSDGLAMANMTAATDAIWAGRYDMAPQFLERANELFWTSGNEQMKPWVLLQEAWLRQMIGEPQAARVILIGLQQIGSNHGGVYRTGVEEHLLMVEADLGEWDGSASAWVNSTQFRRDSGLVQTSFERELSLKAKALVKDRMGDSYLRLKLQQGPTSF